MIHATMTSVRKRRCTFYDMKHSNNAARIRLWLRLNKDALDVAASSEDVVVVETKWMSHDDIESDSYASINPLKKVPALMVQVAGDQSEPLHLFEASVILNYLEDVLPASVLKMADSRKPCSGIPHGPMSRSVHCVA